MRVEDMRGVDLARWRFDWDLTFTMIAAHPDGTVLHRYGGRDSRAADHWLNPTSLKAFLRAGLTSYAEHSNKGRANVRPEPRSLEQVPSFASHDKGDCIHCHSIHPALRLEAQAADKWSLDDLWIHPAPGRIGLDLHRQHQTRVVTVTSGSSVAAAGVQVGDRLVSLRGQALATASDLMAALHELPNTAIKAQLRVVRDPTEPPLALELSLPTNWKATSPAHFAWRPSKWGLSPAPGFGGPTLNENALRKIGLDPSTFAFRVTYLVTWGEGKHWGQRAARAGIREGQVILGAGAKRDFDSIEHFHAWWRLTHKAGDSVDVHLWDNGKPRKLTLPIGE